MTVRFYLKRPNANRISGIYAQLHFNQTVFKYYLLEKVHPEDWNFNTQRAKQNATNLDSHEFNQCLKEIKGKISNAFYNYQNTHNGQGPIPSLFKEILDGIFNKQSQARMDRELQRTFWGFLQNFIDRMQSGTRVHLQKHTPLSQSTINNVRNLKRHLLDMNE